MATNNASNEHTSALGTILQGQGVGTASAYSTATYPSTAGTAGKILISDGTNIVSSTPTYPNTSGTAGKVVISDGTNNVYSTPTFPNASATARKIIVSDGTNWVASTETWAAAGGAGTILRSDGTNWVATTSTYPNTNAISTLLYASAANVMSALATANNGVLLTSATGVPSITAAGTSTTPTCVGSTTAGTTTYTTQVGRYLRLGPLVIYTFQVAGTFGGTAAGNANISIPVTSINTASLNNYGAGLGTVNSVALSGSFQIGVNATIMTYIIYSSQAAATVVASQAFNFQGTIVYFAA